VKKQLSTCFPFVDLLIHKGDRYIEGIAAQHTRMEVLWHHDFGEESCITRWEGGTWIWKNKHQ